MSTLDLVLFFVAVIGSIAFGLWKGRAKTTAQQGGAATYFLAGRGLTWWLVGFSLIAANISTEQFVGMTGQAANWLGLAIASYEWMAAVTLVVVAFVFLPKLLRCGIYTVPEFLEYRFGWGSRTVMAIATMIIVVGVPTASVIYSGAKVVTVFFQDTNILGYNLGNMGVACWTIGIIAAIYVFIGGLKACAWTDLIHGSMLMVSGILVFGLALYALGHASPHELITTKVETSQATVQQIADAGPVQRLALLNSGPAMPGPNGSGGKLHLVRPASDPFIPWTALVFAMWIPHFFYWGLNQFIVQRTLGSKSLAEGQKGIVFAAFLKLILPFAVVLPGLIAFNLYSADLSKQAEMKNEPVIAEFTAGTAHETVYSFDQSFAKLHPELAVSMIEANIAKVGMSDAYGIPATISNAQTLHDINIRVLAAAKEKNLKEATMVAGYDYDAAYGTLLRHLLKPGVKWFVLSALFGAVVSALASMLNAAATIFTMDIFHRVMRNASQGTLVGVGRLSTIVFVIISCLIAPNLGSPKYNGIFAFMQEFQGYIGPGVLCVFLFGFLVPKAPRYCGWLGIAFNAALYGVLMQFASDIAFLTRWAICFIATAALLGLVTLIRPLKEPIVLPVNQTTSLEHSRTAKICGLIVVALTIVLYIVFW